MPFDKNVFINCPFDAGYTHLLRALLFVLLYLELEPRISQTRSSSNIRINQIKQHIRESRYGIHDLSRSRTLEKNELPRFNMPYELGLDIGCAEFGEKKFRKKQILILETEKYYYQKVLSDIAGQDIENHNDDPKILVQKLRNWFSTIDESKEYPGPNEIWASYMLFDTELTALLVNRKYSLSDMEEMPVADYIKFVKGWIARFNA